MFFLKEILGDSPSGFVRLPPRKGPVLKIAFCNFQIPAAVFTRPVSPILAVFPGAS